MLASRRYLPHLVIGIGALLPACDSATSATSTSADPPASTTTSTTLVATTTSLATTTTTHGRIGEMTVEPSPQAHPGQDWRACGTYYAGREVQIVVAKAGTDLSWLPSGPTVVPVSKAGEFCWAGAFPDQMVDEMTGEVSEIAAGAWTVIARDSATGQSFASVDIVIG